MMRDYAKLLCLVAASVAMLAFAFLVIVLLGSILNSAVQGDWLRAVAHTICLLVSVMMVVLLTCYIDDTTC